MESRQAQPRSSDSPGDRKLYWLLRASVLCYVMACLPCPPLPTLAQETNHSTAQSAAVDNEHLIAEPSLEYDLDHWAYRPLSLPPVPEADRDWIQNPIDAFIWRGLERGGIQPSPQALPRVLIRRLTLGLHGLPPEYPAVLAFEADHDPQAYERLVDRLLADPAYGERWAQHWLDLARFAETDGFEHDKTRPEAWRYRDWVVQALNQDMPYDQFVRWQLAGDLLELKGAAADQAKIATAFCLSGPDMPDINSQQERLHNLLNELTATVGEVFLGLQLGCAQCHDHKYDPISQLDFYRLRAFFANSVEVRKNRSVSYLHAVAAPTEAHAYIRGEWDRPAQPVSPALLRLVTLSDLRESRPAGNVQETQTPSLTRLDLANQMLGPGQALMARVIVNRIWQYHFGRGLFESPSDVGVMGLVPSHPELLDYLACELVAKNWSLKHLHRLILTSATYRQSSSRKTPAAAKQGHRLYGAFPLQRLAGEVVRDSMLAVSRRLSRRMGGPGVMPPLPAELQSTLLRHQWKTSEHPEDHGRRSLYVFARRNLRYPIFDTFDRPDANRSCPQRARSTTALQSLSLLNSPFTYQVAERLAASAQGNRNAERQPDAATDWPQTRQVKDALQEVAHRLFARDLEHDEIERLQQFLNVQTRERIQEQVSASEARESAWRDLCLALLNTHEFIYVE